MSDLTSHRVPTFCPICKLVMKGKSTMTYFQWGCCVNCQIQFIDDREDRWKSGWRPSEEEVAAYVARLVFTD